MVTEAFITACALFVVAVRGLEVDAVAGNYRDFLWYRGDRKVVGCNGSVLWFVVIFCRIDALRNEVLFFGGILGVIMLP